MVFNTKKEATLVRLLSKFREEMGIPITVTRTEQMVSDKNFKVYLETPLTATTWPEAVLEAIGRGQRLSYSWHMMGDAESYLEASAKDLFRTTGLLWVHWYLDKNE